MNNNAQLRRYTWNAPETGLDTPLAVYDVATATSYFHRTDANKNVIALTNASGLKAWYEYSPFGVTLTASGDAAELNPFRFSSEYADSETGLVYYNYRYYNPELGRWLSRDPIAEEGGENLYGFVGNSNLNSFDRLGLDFDTISVSCVLISQSKDMFCRDHCIYECRCPLGWSPVGSTFPSNDCSSVPRKSCIREKTNWRMVPLLLFAGALVLVDGPLPLGDAIAAGIVAAAI